LAVPFSTFASPQAKTPFLEFSKFYERFSRTKGVAEQRQMFSDFLQPALNRTRVLYPVDSVPTIVAGVYTDIITPKDGIASGNQNRVLINLHGGGFMMGARVLGAMESIPVASLGKIKVVTVDYRQGRSISSRRERGRDGGLQGTVKNLQAAKHRHLWMLRRGYADRGGDRVDRKREAAEARRNRHILCLCRRWSGGDSAALGLALMGLTPSPQALAPPHPSVSNAAYFSEADFNDPLVEPIRSLAVLAKFPPTLIITSTRDLALSPAVYTHTQLVKLGVDAELYVWEGMSHGFFTGDPDLPEAKEAWNVVVRFF